MLYIGYSITIEEAYRLLGLSIKDSVYYYQLEYINTYCKSKNVGISVYPIGKYCVMLSYKCEEVSDVWNKHVSVTSFITQLQIFTQKIKSDLEVLNVDLSTVSLITVEGEEYTSNYPEPIVWNWED